MFSDNPNVIFLVFGGGDLGRVADLGRCKATAVR